MPTGAPVTTTDDYQRLASEQGREFEQVVAFSLRSAGWAIDAVRAVVAGAEIDIVATDPTGQQWWIECKGSYRGKTPGAVRGDTTKKAVAVAAYLAVAVPDDQRRPYKLVTSHLPRPGTLGDRMLRAALEQGWFAAVEVAGGLTHYEDD